jgi:peptidoglycan/LPS O-acetylase OafA/YrhL
MLADCVSGRDNNLNLIRMIAAVGVFVSHAYPLTLGEGAAQPLEQRLGFTLGLLSVYTFFIISGLLISQSFDRRRGALDFVLARVLRIFPALLVVVVATVVVLGPAVTALPIDEYVASPETASYAPRNLSLAFLQYGLPGVFVDNPYPAAINGSLWTLFYEVVCYGGVFALGLVEARFGRWKLPAVILVYAAAYLGVAAAAPYVGLHPKVVLLQQMSLPFVVGMAFWRMRERLPLHPAAFVLALAAVSVMAATTVVFELFVIAWGYVVIYLAYAPKTVLLGYNRLGDFSYGFYILAFPIQQLVVHLGLADTPLENMLWAFVPTLALAALSWRLIERPALRARRPLGDALDRLRAPRRSRAARPAAPPYPPQTGG